MQSNDWKVAVEVNEWLRATCHKQELRTSFEKMAKQASIDQLYAIAGYLALTSATDSDDQLMVLLLDELTSRQIDPSNFLPPILKSLKAVK